MSSRADIKKIVTRLLKNASTFYESDDVDIVIDGARDTYSRHRKLWIVAEITSNGSRVYDVPAGWQDGYSDDGYKIEYPIDDGAAVPTFLLPTMHELYWTPSGKKIRFVQTDHTNALPVNGKPFRVHMPARYEVSEAKVQIPDAHIFPFAALAAAYLCLVCASVGAQQEDQVIEGGLVDFKNKDDKFIKLSKEYFKIYKDAILPDEGDTEFAASFGEFATDEYHRTQRPAFPRDESDRTIVDI